MRCQDRLCILFSRQVVKLLDDSTDIVRRETIFRLFDGQQSKDRRPHLVWIECTGLPLKDATPHRVKRKNQADVPQRLLSIAQSRQLKLPPPGDGVNVKLINLRADSTSVAPNESAASLRYSPVYRDVQAVFTTA